MDKIIFLSTFVIFVGAFIGGADSWGRSSPELPVYKENGQRYNEDDCRKSAARHQGKCGVIFEKKECDDGLFKTGSEKAITKGNWINLRGTGFHEDVESILVAPGCVLFGYDENDQDARGTGISVSAVGKQNWVYRELNSHDFDLENDIEAVECYCGQKAIQATEILPLVPRNSLDRIAGWANFGTATKHCNMWIHAFNRLPINKRPCAILFESEDCETSDGVVFKDWHKEIMPNRRVFNLPELSLGAKADSAEAVLVRPGCTFSGYSEDNGLGKEVTVTAPRPTRNENSKRPKFYPLASKYNPFKSGLNEDIDSYKCTC